MAKDKCCCEDNNLDREMECSCGCDCDCDCDCDCECGCCCGSSSNSKIVKIAACVGGIALLGGMIAALVIKNKRDEY